MTTGSAIQVEGLVKTYGSHRALDGLDLEVKPGEVHGFLGPNGAGKSTTLRALLGLLHVDSGRAEILGMDPWRDAVAVHRRLAYVPGDVTLWPQLTGGEALDVLARFHGGTDKARRDDLIRRFEFDPTKKGRTYSKGNRQKVALISAFSADVELLLLDEPTSGLDPLMEEVFRECLAEAMARGATVLLSSHILSEVEQLADGVTIIRAGRRLETGTLTELRHLTRTRMTGEFARNLTSEEAETVKRGVPEVIVEGKTFSGEIDQETVATRIASLNAVGGGLVRVNAAVPSLEQVFLTHYRDASS